MLATRVLAAYLFGERSDRDLGLNHEGLSSSRARKNPK
jgi:hypothetical protein